VSHAAAIQLLINLF